MASCKDCLCYDICHQVIEYNADIDKCTGDKNHNMDKECIYFRCSSNYIKLPCQIGDYIEWDWGIKEDTEVEYHQILGFEFDQFGKVNRYITECIRPVVNHVNIRRIVPKLEAEKIMEGKDK